MACPLFIPSSPLPLSQVAEAAATGAPLGELYAGSCAADLSAEITPQILRRCCNFGYGRGECGRAAQSDSDAVRFMVKNFRDGVVVEIAWSVERDHHPVAVGTLDVVTGASADSASSVLQRQARACAEVYARRVQELPSSPLRTATDMHLLSVEQEAGN
jgi:hypothetical protein